MQHDREQPFKILLGDEVSTAVCKTMRETREAGQGTQSLGTV